MDGFATPPTEGDHPLPKGAEGESAIFGRFAENNQNNCLLTKLPINTKHYLKLDLITASGSVLLLFGACDPFIL